MSPFSVYNALSKFKVKFQFVPSIFTDRLKLTRASALINTFSPPLTVTTSLSYKEIAVPKSGRVSLDDLI